MSSMRTFPPAVFARTTGVVRAVLFCALCLSGFPVRALGPVNSWTKPTSGSWEEQAYWSLGVLPDQTQSIVFTNAGWKALAIGTNGAQSFPSSMQVDSLTLSAPADSYNVLLLNFAGLQAPLKTGSLTVQANSSVVLQSSSLAVLTNNGSTGDLVLGGTLNQGDFSLVEVRGNLNLGSVGSGAYYLTNGTLTVFLREILGGSVPSKFIQYGGWNNLVTMEISQNGEYDLYGGQVTGTQLIVGFGGVSGSFFQHGGNVNADIAIGAQGYGRYVLNAGNLTGKMTVPSSDRGNGYVQQNGGTNFASSLIIGNGTRYGGQGGYVMSNGVVTVASSTMIRGFGDFSQYGGQHAIASNLVLHGSDLFQYGPANASYLLSEGSLSAQSLTLTIGVLSQSGGSNQISGDVTIGPAALGSLYSLTGGFLSDSNVILIGAPASGFSQSNGTHMIASQLIISGTAATFLGYTLGNGSLFVKDISISNGAAFHHTGGTIIQTGILTLANGIWETKAGTQSLGSLQLSIAQGSSSVVRFPSGPTTLRLANSGSQSWSAQGLLMIDNWSGSASGGGQSQLYFGTDATGLTGTQISQIKFRDPAGYPLGLYPPRLLSTGELIPIPDVLAASRSANNLALSWAPGWILQSSTNLTGPYQDVPSATSPYTAPLQKPAEFFRLRK